MSVVQLKRPSVSLTSLPTPCPALRALLSHPPASRRSSNKRFATRLNSETSDGRVAYRHEISVRFKRKDKIVNHSKIARTLRMNIFVQPLDSDVDSFAFRQAGR